MRSAADERRTKFCAPGGSGGEVGAAAAAAAPARSAPMVNARRARRTDGPGVGRTGSDMAVTPHGGVGERFGSRESGFTAGGDGRECPRGRPKLYPSDRHRQGKKRHAPRNGKVQVTSPV